MKYCPFNILDLHMTWQKLANWDWLIVQHSEISKNNANNHNQNNKMKRKFVQCNTFYQTSDLNENAIESYWLFQEHFLFKTVALLCYIANDSFLLFFNYFARAAVLMWPIFLFITRSKHFLQKTSCFQNFCNEFQIFNTELYPVKRLKGSFLRKYLTAFSRAKSSILDVSKVSECLSTVIMLLLENQIFIWETVSHGMYRSKFVYMTNQYPNAKLTVWENTLPVKYRS